MATPVVEMRNLGNSSLQVPVIGIGAWSWGDRSGYWGYGAEEFGKDQCRSAYNALMGAGLTFIDTAEVYGFGKSEEFLAEFANEGARNGLASPIIATKFAPLPWRQSSDSVVEAAKASLKRLQADKMALYMIHWPGFLFNAFSNEQYVLGLAKVQQQGLAQAVGVSNFNKTRTANAARTLIQEGTCLASNQVQYSLLYRTPETNGVMDACKENGVTLVAYSPLCQGLLTGKYTVNSAKPAGPRSSLFTDSRLREIEPLLATLKAVADGRGKTMAQVALNWTVCKGALPIPGAKNEKQLAEIAGSVGWRLDDGEMAELDKASSKVSSGSGAPFENW
ncbi:MAG: hypothetical protein WDW36_003984 [Sanguina aurantia]